MAQLEGGKRFVFPENFHSHSARDKIARATGGRGTGATAGRTEPTFKWVLKGMILSECTTYYIYYIYIWIHVIYTIMLCLCVYSGVVLLGYLGPRTKWTVFVGCFRTQVDSMGFGTQMSISQISQILRRLCRGSWGSWASGRNPKFQLCNLWLWKRYHQRRKSGLWIHENILGEESQSPTE